MITYEDIQIKSKPHLGRMGGKRFMLENDNVVISIVGGCSGLYGDFISTFEVAVIDKKTGGFVTKYFFPDETDDIIPWMRKDDLLEFINKQVVGFRIT